MSSPEKTAEATLGPPPVCVTKTTRHILWCTIVVGLVTLIWLACCGGPEYLNFPPTVKVVYLQYFDAPLFVAGALAGVIGTYLGFVATKRRKLSTVLFCILSIFFPFALVVHGALLVELFVNSRKTTAVIPVELA